MLDRVANEIYKCLRCGWCREYANYDLRNVCPAREMLGFESAFARGRMLLARGLLEGELSYSDKLIERMYTCLGCAACQVKCPLEVNTVEVFRTMREDAVKKGVPLPEPLLQINNTVEKFNNPLGKDQSERNRMMADLELGTRGEVLYFAGCYDTFRNPTIFRGTVKLLRSAGVEPGYLGGQEWCCGVPEIWNGSAELAKKLARHNVEEFKRAGAKVVVTSCAGCFNALGHYYRALLGEELPFKVVHITQFLAQALEDGRIRVRSLEEEKTGKITYHDPCHLGRHMKVYEEPRRLLRELFPHSFVEMPRNRDESWCCGGGAVVFPYLTQYSLRIAEKRIDEAKSVDAKSLVTACPSCINVLRVPARKIGLEVKNIVEYLATAVE